jgi:hypothetical protein
MIQSCLKKRTNKKVPEVLEVLESLLCFDARLNQSHHWETSNPTHVARIMPNTRIPFVTLWIYVKSPFP